MSIIPAQGVLRYLYEKAAEDPRYKALPFWNASLQHFFDDGNLYAVVTDFESPTEDAAAPGANTIVRRFDPEQNTLSPLLFLRSGEDDSAASLEELEEQTRAAALRRLAADGGGSGPSRDVYVATTIGPLFRLWAVTDEDGGALRPLHGTQAGGDKSQYVDADSAGALVFAEIVEKVKRGESV